MKKKIAAIVLALSMFSLALPASAAGTTWYIHTERCSQITYSYQTHSDSTGYRHRIIQLNEWMTALGQRCDAFVQFQRYYASKGWITVGSKELSNLYY